MQKSVPAKHSRCAPISHFRREQHVANRLQRFRQRGFLSGRLRMANYPIENRHLAEESFRAIHIRETLHESPRSKKSNDYPHREARSKLKRDSVRQSREIPTATARRKGRSKTLRAPPPKSDRLIPLNPKNGRRFAAGQIPNLKNTPWIIAEGQRHSSGRLRAR